jgi:membrane-bound serine protease (ClpP class)
MIARTTRLKQFFLQLWTLPVSVLLIFSMLLAATPAVPQEPQRVVYVAQIEGIIDLGLAPYVNRVIQDATQAGAAAVVLEINTFGGRVDAAVQIRDTLLNSKVPTIAFINKRAISAGALISLAAEKIVMGTGGTIGAATPVQAGQPGAASQPVEEKTVSYVRKEFRATAEARKRPLLIAEAMVDSDVVIAGVTTKGKLLTLTTEESLRLKVADYRADTLEDALKVLGLEGAEIRQATPNWAENVLRFLTHPMVSSLLITIAMVGILIELRTPGFGFPGAIGVSSLGLFLWGHWIVQLAGWEELLIAAVGVALLVIELIFIPGFGLAGIAGILAIFTGLVMSMVGPGDTPQFIIQTTGRVVFSILLALAALLVFMRFLPRMPIGRKLILDTALEAGQGFESAPASDHALIGKTGKTTTPLHPAGIAQIEGERIDVVSEGELIDAGELISVVRVDGNRVVVRRVDSFQKDSS